MYIHIGGDVSVLKKSIIGIFDMDNTTVSKWTRQFLKYSEEKESVVTVSDELPRTFILTENGRDKKIKVYISPISASTLQKRAEEYGLGE